MCVFFQLFFLDHTPCTEYIVDNNYSRNWQPACLSLFHDGQHRADKFSQGARPTPAYLPIDSPCAADGSSRRRAEDVHTQTCNNVLGEQHWAVKHDLLPLS